MRPHQVFSALGDETRFEVLNILASSGPASASTLARELPVSRQAISKHLTALHEAGLLRREREGREVVYVFEPGPLDEVSRWVNSVGDAWDARLARLKENLG